MENMATIQWFPGHMSKARRQVQENLKFVDFVTVLVDARLPLSSQNPMLTKIVGEKPKLMILNKVDLADPVATKEWPKFEDEEVALKLALTGAIKDQLLPMDEVTIFGLNYFKDHYPEVLKDRYKQMNLEQEAPEIIMEMTQKLGFRDDYDRFYQLFVKDVRDGKLGRYTLDRVGEIDGND